MNYDVAKQVQEGIEAEVAARSRVLRSLAPADKGPFGLTPDAVRLSPDYRAAKQAFDEAFSRLRAFNAVFTKAYKAEIAAARRSRRGTAERGLQVQEEGCHGKT